MDRLLTSSSRARSLIRTLLIRPFSFNSPTALAVHFSLFEVGIVPVSIIPEFRVRETADSIPRAPLLPKNVLTHGRARPRRSPRRRPPGSRPPADLWRRCPAQWPPSEHPRPYRRRSPTGPLQSPQYPPSK